MDLPLNKWQTNSNPYYNDEEFIEWATGILNDRLIGASTWDGYVSCVTSDALIESRESGQPEKATMTEQADIYK